MAGTINEAGEIVDKNGKVLWKVQQDAQDRALGGLGSVSETAEGKITVAKLNLPGVGTDSGSSWSRQFRREEY
jgi:hypothetical protein